ncbi:MAG TPA: hypothetical protein VLX31_10775 [Streptosporangiaceae bacterium]|nr:hypothetical protein [Streptosporangiaceae bacterium]
MTTHRGQARGRLIRRRRAFGGTAEVTGTAELAETAEVAEADVAAPEDLGDTADIGEITEVIGAVPAEGASAPDLVTRPPRPPTMPIPLGVLAAALFVLSAPRLLTRWIGRRRPALRLAGLRLAELRLAGLRLAGLRPGARARAKARAVAAVIGAALTWSAAAVTLFAVYLHVAWTSPITSDGASNALQAWDMLHHNLLLRGWQLSDVSFFTTELPQYMLIEHLRGLGPDVIHIASAMTYTLLALLAALLAKGHARGREAIVRCLLAVGIMLAPQAGDGVYVLLGSPDHAGSTVPVLFAFLILDRAPRRWWRWCAPLAAGAVLGWALLADQIVMFTAICPVIAVCLARAYRTWFRPGQLRSSEDQHRRGCWFELELACASLAAIWTARAAQAAITARGGFTVWPISTALVSAGDLPHSLSMTWQGLLLIFGADFLGSAVSTGAALAVAHLAGLGLVGWATCAAVRRFGRADLIVQLLAASIAVTLAAYLLSTRAADLLSARDITAALPLGAALAGRMLAGRLARARLLPAMAVLLAGYLVSLGQVAEQPAASQPDAGLADWLIGHHLDDGLSDYWNANVMTVQSGGRVRLRAVAGAGPRVASGFWEAKAAWYDPRVAAANFVVIAPGAAAQSAYPTIASVRQAFGQPVRIYDLDDYTILVWNKNLLADLVRGTWAPPPAPIVTPPGAEPTSTEPISACPVDRGTGSRSQILTARLAVRRGPSPRPPSAAAPCTARR